MVQGRRRPILPRETTVPVRDRPGWLVFGTAPLTAAVIGATFNYFYASWLLWGVFWILAAAFGWQTYLVLLRFDRLVKTAAAGYGMAHCILSPVATCIGGAMTLSLFGASPYAEPIYILPAVVMFFLNAILVVFMVTHHKPVPRRAPLPPKPLQDPNAEFDVPANWDEAVTPPKP